MKDSLKYCTIKRKNAFLKMLLKFYNPGAPKSFSVCDLGGGGGFVSII